MGRRLDTVTRPIHGLLSGLCLLGLTGCGEGGAAIAGATIAAAVAADDIEVKGRPIRDLGPEAVEVQNTTLRSTAGGCEIEVTYKNLTNRTLSIGFTYQTFDASGRELKPLSTPVQSTGPGETKTISSGNTTAGPSGIPCSQIARTQLKSMTAFTV